MPVTTKLRKYRPYSNCKIIQRLEPVSKHKSIIKLQNQALVRKSPG